MGVYAGVVAQSDMVGGGEGRRGTKLWEMGATQSGRPKWCDWQTLGVRGWCRWLVKKLGKHRAVPCCVAHDLAVVTTNSWDNASKLHRRGFWSLPPNPAS